MRFEVLIVEKTMGTIVVEAKNETEAIDAAKNKDHKFIDIESIGTTVKRVLPFPKGKKFVRK